jgi:23S rRNA U2552 (ribose-2'-O)-methylase RlmE/FtsJ
MSLWNQFQQNTGKTIDKWHHYFPIYERYFSNFRNKKVTFIEIGVFKGGSLQMFSNYLGPFATVVGIDINTKCKQFESEYVHVRIGDQSDPDFLESVLNEFGAPDLVLDDGSHLMHHVKDSFEFIYPRLSKNGIYMVEDMHTSYWKKYGGGYLHKDSFIEYSKNLIDQLNFQHVKEKIPSPQFIRDTSNISFYDSIVVFEKGTISPKVSSKTGST